jgi:hypothetical protein
VSNPLTIYTAAPIDLGSGPSNWRQVLVEELQNLHRPAVLFDPGKAYAQALWGTRDLGRTRYIEDTNRFALETANIVIACLPKTVATVGTPIEIEFAHAAAKTLLLVTDIKPGTSVYLDNRIPLDNWFWCDDLKDEMSLRTALIQVATWIDRSAVETKDNYIRGTVSSTSSPGLIVHGGNGYEE